jgi:hypothetical protein
MFSKVIFDLEKIASGIEKDTFEYPPDNHDKFMEAVGKRNGILIAITAIRESLKEDDELI